MKPRVFLDTNVFIYGFEFSDSNSAKIISLLNKGEIEAVVSERVLKEIIKYFEKFYSSELAKKFRRYILQTCILIMQEEIKEQMNELKGKIKDKDLEQLATVRKYGLKFLVSYDRDFEAFEEYVTPKKFLEKIGKENVESEF